MIGGESFIFVVGRDGFVYASPVNQLGKFYIVARRYFKYQENLYMFNRDGYYTGQSGTGVDNQNTSRTVKIITAAKTIYLLSNEQCWAINADGIVDFNTDGTVTAHTMIVDALNATVHDIENETPKLQSVDRVCSTLRKDDRIYVRAKSELGGYGAPSNDVTIPETNGYIVYGIKGMTNTCSIKNKNFEDKSA